MTGEERAEDLVPSTAEQSGAESLPWARQPVAPRQRSTSRARRVVEGLPGWEPMPPGETVVRRPQKG